MYQVLQLVVYGVHGVCRILELEVRMVDHKPVSYYVLEPLAQPGTRYYLPSHNETAMAKIRPLTDKGRLQEMLQDDTLCAPWIPAENQRKQSYRQLLTNIDVAALISMLRCMDTYRQSQALAGRKLHICDENFLRDAKRVLASEVSVVLQMDPLEMNDLLFGNVA
ncbi:MAG: hypothetical protein IKY59_05135, partial [Oscillospiraceae bacterium]|nr:hypothetical protein [Oscillospiraceae bacterium]